MDKTRRKLIRIISPALRGIYGNGNKLPRIRFVNECSNTDKCKKVSVKHAEPDKIVKDLRDQLKFQSESDHICVEGLGCFIVEQLTQSNGRLCDKVALVTGAAQGFGFEIAMQMSQEGAFVILADINAAKIDEAAEQICKQFGSGKALGLVMDVADPASVAEAMDHAIAVFGGLDVLIANAGVLKAESVKTMAVEDFDFVTKVNYKGYFLCAQAAANIMSVQHMANDKYLSDIIQVNSKSGLEGSKCNGAYAGSKFGGIGLTQSFAVELIEDGIKVNSVCPGNFFDGPLWSDPENGLFVQYLRTNKVPGAKTISDVQKAYESKVPMGRGCRTEDVFKAVCYLIEQEYETGQAVPVTGGQVMLR